MRGEDPEDRRRNVVKAFRQHGFHFYGRVGGARQFLKGGGQKEKKRKVERKAIM